MKGIKTVAANLANRVNQQHYLESELLKVFNAGYKLGAKITEKSTLVNLLKENISHLAIDRSDHHHDLRDFESLMNADYESIADGIIESLLTQPLQTP